MNLAEQNPVPNQTDVPLNQLMVVKVEESNPSYTVVDALTQVYLDENGEDLVYDGGAGGFQTGFTGTKVVLSDGIRFSFTKDGQDLFETFPYSIHVVSENSNGEGFDESYSWSTARYRALNNSGFEAAGASSGFPKDWSLTLRDPGSQIGVKRGRVENPAIWTPPEGKHILAFGSTDLIESLDYFAENQDTVIGVGTSGTSDAFSGYLSLPENTFVEAAQLLKNGSEVVASYDSRIGWLDNSPSNGLVAYFKMNDDAADTVVAEATGSGVSNGVLQGGDNTEDKSETGKVGGCLRFNGVDDYVQVAQHALLRPDKLTVMAWVKIDADIPTNAYAVILPWEGAWGAPYLSYTLNANYNGAKQPLFQISVGGSIQTLIGTAMTPGVWHLLIGVYDGSQMRLYVDAVLNGTPINVSGVISYPTANQDLVIGMRSANSPGQYFKGVIDEVRVYNYAMSSKVINQIYNGGNPAEASSPFPASVAPVNGGLSPWSGRYSVEEAGEQIWDAGESVTIRATHRSMALTHKIEQSLDDVSLTPWKYLKVNYKWAAPATFAVGTRWLLRAYIDSIEVFSKTLTSADINLYTEGYIVADVSALNGPLHKLAFSLTMLPADDSSAVYDGGVVAVEGYSGWCREGNNPFNDTDAQAAAFDGDAVETETFAEWCRDGNNPFVEAQATPAEFDGDSVTTENFSEWSE